MNEKKYIHLCTVKITEQIKLFKLITNFLNVNCTIYNIILFYIIVLIMYNYYRNMEKSSKQQQFFYIINVCFDQSVCPVKLLISLCKKQTKTGSVYIPLFVYSMLNLFLVDC